MTLYTVQCDKWGCVWQCSTQNVSQAVHWADEHDALGDGHIADVIDESEDIAALMQPGGTDWRDDALCKEDKRFLHPAQTAGLNKICANCPVFTECSQWAEGKAGVFAAGHWRDHEIVEPWHGIATGSTP